ncbi:hypothetical protein RF679_04400 [Undibacterium cyanobacteriorum]|uniref:FAD/NAD(P)-binding domain-containing protein n=1 Tax=Undibacterium cyanobacteriorum TaxID=3073561 RepID=A0ABY9RKP3_9BURK|nr:hypothetical protein [Undibacterium sp. 20NA77.5]WMW81526.1 hypothetical protein RF679_04400 [Undibacterium sp. 20NA77.5]
MKHAHADIESTCSSNNSLIAMLSLNRIFHNSADLPLIRRELLLVTARCGITGATRLSTELDRSMLMLQLHNTDQGGQQQRQQQQAPTWTSSAALCDRIEAVDFQQGRVHLRGQRYRFEVDVIAFATHHSAADPQHDSLHGASLNPIKFDEVIFVGDAQKCVSQALRCSHLSRKMMVLGRSQLDHAQRVVRQQLHRLQGHQEKTLKAIAP